MTAPSLQLNTPISSVKIMNEEEDAQAAREGLTSKELEQEKQRMGSLCNALQQTVACFEEFNEKLFLSHKEQIVRLSVEIAARILAKDIHERNYEIEKIVSQALQTVPASKQIMIRLNPDDLKTMREMIDANEFTTPEGVRFTGNVSVGPAECMIETDHGVIEYLIEEHLKQVAGVLSQTKDDSTKQEK